jgi:hypothetical protein
LLIALGQICPCFFSCSLRRRSAGRRQCLANSGPLSVDVRKRTIVEMPPDIDPFSVAAHENFRATTAIYHGFTLEPRLENVGIVKNRRISVRGNSSRRSCTPCSFIAFAKAIR